MGRTLFAFTFILGLYLFAHVPKDIVRSVLLRRAGGVEPSEFQIHMWNFLIFAAIMSCILR